MFENPDKYPLSAHSDQRIPTEVVGPVALLHYAFTTAAGNIITLPQRSEERLDKRVYVVAELWASQDCIVGFHETDPAVVPPPETVTEDLYFIPATITDRQRPKIVEITDLYLSAIGVSAAGNLYINLLQQYQGFASRDTAEHV